MDVNMGGNIGVKIIQGCGNVYQYKHRFMVYVQ
jgi:hypothetical protein